MRSHLWILLLFPCLLYAEDVPTSQRHDLKPLFLVGGDISTLTKIESLGGVFKDENGPDDAIKILRRQGWNCFRLRLFVHPNGHNAVVQDLPYALALAHRIKDAGAQLLLDLHYSDTWADPAHQLKPTAWANLDFDVLVAQVRHYSAQVISAFKAEGVLPDIVQVGNEITPGFLWQDGRIYRPGDTTEHWAEFTTLLKAGIASVLAPLGPDDHMRVMIHIDCGARWEKTRYFFSHLAQYQVNFDIIGQSYYPWWHGSLEDVRLTLERTAHTFDKDMMIVETAYPWTHADTWQGRDNMAWPVTKAGQALFLRQLAQVVRETPNHRGIGVIYWYPEAIQVPGMSVWNNGATALFDSNGLVLEGAHSLTQPVNFKVPFYIGTYTHRPDGSKGIYRSTLDLVNGDLSAPVLVAQTPNPSFLSISPDAKTLVAVSSQTGGAVKSYAIDSNSGRLTYLNQQSSGGAGPCHVSIDPSGKVVLVANYGSGSISAMPLGADGILGSPTATLQHHGSSINPTRQQGPHAHCVKVAPNGRLVLSADLGTDKVMLYGLNAEKAILTLHDPPFIAITPGSGPRHLAFHPNSRFMYVINEINSTITALSYNASSGTFSTLQTLSTLPADFHGFNKAAEIRVHPNGRFLYASNRGHNSMAVFKIDPTAGTLTAVAYQTRDLDFPRYFTLDPTGRYCLVANKDGHSIVVFQINQKSGVLEPTDARIEIAEPVCIQFLP